MEVGNDLVRIKYTYVVLPQDFSIKLSLAINFKTLISLIFYFKTINDSNIL